MNLPIILAVAAAILGPLVVFIEASRRLSGKITTSDASDLWEESRATREFLRVELDKSSGRITVLEERVGHLEKCNADLERENRKLHREINELMKISND